MRSLAVLASTSNVTCKRHIICLISVAKTDTFFAGQYTWIVLWTAIESGCGIMCCCIPTIRPLLARTFPSIFIEKDVLESRTYYNTDREISGGKRTHDTESRLDQVMQVRTSIEITTDYVSRPLGQAAMKAKEESSDATPLVDLGNLFGTSSHHSSSA